MAKGSSRKIRGRCVEAVVSGQPSRRRHRGAKKRSSDDIHKSPKSEYFLQHYIQRLRLPHSWTMTMHAARRSASSTPLARRAHRRFGPLSLHAEAERLSFRPAVSVCDATSAQESAAREACTKIAGTGDRQPLLDGESGRRSVAGEQRYSWLPHSIESSAKESDDGKKKFHLGFRLELTGPGHSVRQGAS